MGIGAIKAKLQHNTVLYLAQTSMYPKVQGLVHSDVIPDLKGDKLMGN